MVKVMRRGAPVFWGVGGIVVFHYPGLVVLFSKSITFLGGDFKLIYYKELKEKKNWARCVSIL